VVFIDILKVLEMVRRGSRQLHKMRISV